MRWPAAKAGLRVGNKRKRLGCFVDRSRILRPRGQARKVALASIATWLILPVVIRSSQRLSHACVSINKFLLWNCERLIISVIVYLIIFDYWITVVILELIHAQSPDCLGGMYLLDNNQQFVLSHDNLADRIWRQIIQVSALSAFDGSVLDYHGIHG